MNDNRERLSEAVGLLERIAQVLMRAIQAQPGKVSVSDLTDIRRLEALARKGAVSVELAEGLAATRRALMRINRRETGFDWRPAKPH